MNLSQLRPSLQQFFSILSQPVIYMLHIVIALCLLFTPATFAIAEEISTAKKVTIDIEGLEGEQLNNVRQSLSIFKYTQKNQKKHLKASSTSFEKTIRRAHSKAEKEIQQALYPFGFYQPIVSKTLTQIDNQWHAVYRVGIGQAVKIYSMTIDVKGEGKVEPALQLLLADPIIKQGDVLSHQYYTQYKEALYDALFELGYIDATYEKSEIRVDIKNHQADITLQLNSGKQYYFGNLDIKQNVIEPKVIEPLITIDENTPFNTNRLLELQLKLADTGYFSQTDIAFKKEEAINQRIPVTIVADPSKKLKYSASVGFGTDTGPRVGANVLNRRVNRRGHSLQYGARLSPIEKNLNIKYTIPIDNISSEYFDFSANANRETVNELESTQYNIGVSLNQNKWGGRRRLSLNLIQEEFSFDNEANNTSLLLVPRLTYTRQESDNNLFTRKGYSFNVDVHGGLKSALSETTFLHTRFAGRLVLPVNKRSRFLSRAEIGAIVTDQFDNLPPSQRFFVGGSQSIRGYGYKDIGPRNSFNNNIGGQYLIAASVELDYLPWGNSGFAVFYDIGDATSNSFSLKKSVGIGFRYRSPVGMIRVDLAHPFDDSEESFRLHISIGPDL